LPACFDPRAHRVQLYDLLEQAPPEVACWLPDGMSFCVNDETLFCDRVLPQFFSHTKLASFQRQLNIYGFRRLAKVRIPSTPPARVPFPPPLAPTPRPPSTTTHIPLLSLHRFVVENKTSPLERS
jgi:hypothetical protein